MPTYEYRCQFCGERAEAFQRMSDEPLVVCPHCGKEGLTRIVSGGAGVIYRGEGWYVTDYSKKSSGGKEQAPKPEINAAEPKLAETKSDTATPKAEPTKETKPAPKTSPKKEE